MGNRVRLVGQQSTVQGLEGGSTAQQGIVATPSTLLAFAPCRRDTRDKKSKQRNCAVSPIGKHPKKIARSFRTGFRSRFRAKKTEIMTSSETLNSVRPGTAAVAHPVWRPDN